MVLPWLPPTKQMRLHSISDDMKIALQLRPLMSKSRCSCYMLPIDSNSVPTLMMSFRRYRSTIEFTAIVTTVILQQKSNLTTVRCPLRISLKRSPDTIDRWWMTRLTQSTRVQGTRIILVPLSNPYQLLYQHWQVYCCISYSITAPPITVEQVVWHCIPAPLPTSGEWRYWHPHKWTFISENTDSRQLYWGNHLPCPSIVLTCTMIQCSHLRTADQVLDQILTCRRRNCWLMVFICLGVLCPPHIIPLSPIVPLCRLWPMAVGISPSTQVGVRGSSVGGPSFEN